VSIVWDKGQIEIDAHVDPKDDTATHDNDRVGAGEVIKGNAIRLKHKCQDTHEARKAPPQFVLSLPRKQDPGRVVLGQFILVLLLKTTGTSQTFVFGMDGVQLPLADLSSLLLQSSSP